MDQITFEILEDGTLSVKTSDISAANHMSADQLLKDMVNMMGGKVEVKKNPEAKNYKQLLNHKPNIIRR